MTDPDNYAKVPPGMVDDLIETLKYYGKAKNHWLIRDYGGSHFAGTHKKSTISKDGGTKARETLNKWEEHNGRNKHIRMDGPKIGLVERSEGGSA